MYLVETHQNGENPNKRHKNEGAHRSGPGPEGYREELLLVRSKMDGLKLNIGNLRKEKVRMAEIKEDRKLK